FEDKLSGITLVDLSARVVIGQRGVAIDHFTARDPRGGQLTAIGGSANPNEGRIAVTVDNVRIADRPEARARASGQLTLAWQGLHSTLSGDLNVLEANLDIAAGPSAGIPTINHHVRRRSARRARRPHGRARYRRSHRYAPADGNGAQSGNL